MKGSNCQSMNHESVNFSYDSKGNVYTTINNNNMGFTHIIPLVNEKAEFCNLIGVYSKDGSITEEESKFIERYADMYKFIFMTASGPYYEKNYKKVYTKYDGVMGLNTNKRVPTSQFGNNLELNYSMMARSGPNLNGFFYNNEGQFDRDFSILTWYKDRNAKVWKDAYRTIIKLCGAGYKGILINQRSGNDEILKDSKLKQYIDNNLLEVYGTMGEKEFHNIMSRARVAIFPNQSDAFPKHIIESLLQNKSIVISPQLLFGVETLKALGSEITLVQDFKKRDYIDNIVKFIDDNKKNQGIVYPREEWLKRYSFDELSKIWAREFSRIGIKNEYERTFCMSHIPRFYDLIKM